MTDRQIKWASQHYWYIGYGVNAEDQLFIRVRHDFIPDETLHFTDYKALRAWAGY